MKNILKNVVLLAGLAFTFSACKPDSTPATRSYNYGVADYPIRGNDLWAVAFALGKETPVLPFQLGTAPRVDKDGDVIASLKVPSGVDSGIAWVDNTDATFNVSLRIGNTKLICYASMSNNFSAPVKGQGLVIDGDNKANTGCAMGSSGGTLLSKAASLTKGMHVSPQTLSKSDFKRE